MAVVSQLPTAGMTAVLLTSHSCLAERSGAVTVLLTSCCFYLISLFWDAYKKSYCLGDRSRKLCVCQETCLFGSAGTMPNSRPKKPGGPPALKTPHHQKVGVWVDSTSENKVQTMFPFFLFIHSFFLLFKKFLIEKCVGPPGTCPHVPGAGGGGVSSTKMRPSGALLEPN
jgi:hypothetical protein